MFSAIGNDTFPAIIDMFQVRRIYEKLGWVVKINQQPPEVQSATNALKVMKYFTWHFTSNEERLHEKNLRNLTDY